jgi:hypothetical protein
MRKFELQSGNSRQKLQVLYNIYLHPSSYKKVTIFWKQTHPNRYGPRPLQVLQYPTIMTVWHYSTYNRHGPWRFTPTAMGMAVAG